MILSPFPGEETGEPLDIQHAFFNFNELEINFCFYLKSNPLLKRPLFFFFVCLCFFSKKKKTASVSDLTIKVDATEFQSMCEELDKLRDENQVLYEQVENIQLQLSEAQTLLTKKKPPPLPPTSSRSSATEIAGYKSKISSLEKEMIKMREEKVKEIESINRANYAHVQTLLKALAERAEELQAFELERAKRGTSLSSKDVVSRSRKSTLISETTHKVKKKKKKNSKLAFFSWIFFFFFCCFLFLN